MSRPGPANTGVRSRPAPALAPDVWLLAVSLAAGLGTARLTQAPGASHVVGPIVATVLAGHLGSSVARRLRLSVPVVLGAGVVAVALATTWGQLLSATRDGIPTTSTWRALVSRFDAAGAVIRSHPTPVPATPEVVLCIATGAGLVAVFGRCIWSWQEARGAGGLVGLVPSFGLFCYTALLSSQVDRLPGVVSYVVGALGFVIVADHAAARGSATRRAGSVVSVPRRLASGAMALLPAVVGAALAVVVPLAASPALATLKVDALPFPPPAGSGQGLGLATTNGPGGIGGGNAVSGGPGTGVRAIDLVDNLRAVLVNRTDDVMFDAQTSLPTYWQVAVLTDFNGQAWLPDPTTEAAAQSFSLSPQGNEVPGLPALPEPAPAKTFRAQVTVADLESTLLPLPPTTISVNTDADVVPGFGAIEPVEAAPGLSYVAVARVPVSPTKAAKSPRTTDKGASTAPGGSAPAATVAASALAPYLKLPTEPAPVVALAHQIVAGAKGPAAQAAALARWFDSGRYHYTLSPPPPTGNALESFLFTTRAGFCQQFAAAYGVLARIDGLPTRIAVGFTTGDSEGRNRYRVTGADAHVWPEVYLGPGTGWTSYEPTPASSGEATGVGVNSGAKSGAQKTRGRSTATTASTVLSQRHTSSAATTVPKPSPLTVRGRTPRPLGAAGGSGHTLLNAVLVAVVVAVLLTLGLWVARRVRDGWDPIGAARQRWRRSRRRPASDPNEEVLDQWRDAAAVLERARLGRRPAETLQEHAARLSSLAGAKWLTPYRPVTAVSPGSLSPGSSGTEIDATVEAYARLAALAARASYGGDPCTPADAADAGHLGAVVRSGLARPSGRGVRVSS
jgi:transglutaminase-like putative cysteine protease